MALPDAPVITGTSREVFDYYGLNAPGIAKKAKDLLRACFLWRMPMSEKKYVIAIDQSTQGTKAMVFDPAGEDDPSPGPSPPSDH